MLYKNLLLQKEWQLKCNEILNRDHYKCQDCGSLGFHNGGNFMHFSTIQDFNKQFEDWRINGQSLSDFLQTNKIPIQNVVKINDFKFRNPQKFDNHFLYSIFLLGYGGLDIITTPDGMEAVCDYEQTTSNATLYLYTISNSIVHNQHPDLTGSVFYIRFDNKLSDSIYVNIEYRLVGYINKLPIENTAINITYNNLFLSLLLRYPSLKYIKGLNVHHKYYIKGHNPWDYSNEALITLCEKCHGKRHQTSTTPVYDENNGIMSRLVQCDRCDGSGYLPQYNHVQHGVCFKCGGEGVVIT